MEGIFEEARKIQASILPRRVPTTATSTSAGRSEPMEASAATSSTTSR